LSGIYGGTQSLRDQLAVALTAAAVTKVNAAQKSSYSYSLGPTLTEAEHMLEEARTLDPANDNARESLHVVQMLRLRGGYN
jgi:hypothetical protein